MRILIAAAHRNLVGGVEKYNQVVLGGLSKRGHELGLLHEYAANQDRETIDAPEINMRAWCLAEMTAGSVLESIGNWNPDIVYVHGFDWHDSVPVEEALLRAYPCVLYIHNYDRACATGQKCFMFPQPEVCTRKIGPACLLHHYPRRCGGLRPDYVWLQFRHHTALNALLNKYQAVLVGSHHMRDEMSRHGVTQDKLHLVPLPAPDFPADSLPPSGRPFSSRILFLGRLTNIKGAEYLVRAIPLAASRLGRTLTAIIAGDGPERANLEELARKLGVQVEFPGWVRTPDKLKIMHEVDLLAVPSLWPEPFGLVGLEAGGLGVPAVGFATGGIPDWLIPGETGELAPSDPPSAAGLADAIVRALESREHYERLCEGAWKHARRFPLATHLDQLESLFAPLSNSNSTARAAGSVQAGAFATDAR